MVSARLLSVLRSFSHEEIRSFEKFLLSPFFNANKNYIKFYKELLKFHPDFRSDLLTSEYIFGRMFTGKQYNKQVMWNLNSGLEKLAEEFITQLSLIKKPHDKFNLIIDEFRLRILGKHFKKKLREWESMNDINLIDEDRLYNLASLEDNKIAYWQQIKGIWGKQSENYFELSQIYTLFYLLNITRILSSLNTANKFRAFTRLDNIAADFLGNTNFEKVIEISKRNKYRYADLIEFYYNVIYYHLNPEGESSYFKARKFLFKNHILFSDKEKKDLTSNLANYCIEKNQIGAAKFLRELFNINKFRLEQGIAVYSNGKISKIIFKQIVTNASALKEIRWVEQFVEKYTPLLHEEHRDSMKKLSKAYICFNTGKYSDVLNWLKKFNSDDAADKIAVKNLIAKTYYEMKEFELLLYHIDSTKHFLKNNKKLGTFPGEVNNRFYNYLHSIVRACEKEDTDKLTKLKERLDKENRVNQKIWLLEKIEELETM